MRASVEGSASSSHCQDGRCDTSAESPICSTVSSFNRGRPSSLATKLAMATSDAFDGQWQGPEVHIDVPGSPTDPKDSTPRSHHKLVWFSLVAGGMAALISLVVAGFTGGFAELQDASEPEPSVARRLGVQSNPFQDKVFYVNPSYQVSLTSSIQTAEGSVKETLEAMMDLPSAYWLDKRDKIHGTSTNSMEGILEDAASKPVPELVVFIVYDLPNRDCHAKASNGELCCSYKDDGRCDYLAVGDGSCKDGLKQYKEEYIDQIASVLREFSGRVPIVLVIEPDSLPNLSTNQHDPRCGNAATKSAYKRGVSYAVKALAEADPYAAIYLDAGHGGWLGWRDNMKDFVQTIRGLRVSDHIRGFASNVAGYQYVGEVCPEYDWCLNNAHPDDSCCNDPCGLTSEWNPSHNELQYALHLRKAMSEGIRDFEPHMIIDTGRNGVAGMRSDCANWCNIRGAGVGLAATTNTAKPSVVDAYFWLKTPGESDGCSQTLPDGSTCPRFDEDCASADSISFLPDEPRAPEAGQWFDYQIKQLAENARLYDSDTTTEASETTGGESTSSGPEKPDGNPFEDKVFYVNPSYQVSLTSSIQTAEGSVKETLEAMMDLPSAYWLDKRDKIHGTSTNSMEGILEDAASKPVPELVVFIVYDLPNRDCHAKASNGELCCSYKDDGRCDYLAVGDGSCKEGLKQYKEEYIDQIASVLRKFSGRVPIVLVIEPDSLPNLSTNLQDPRCGNAATKSAYKRGVSYAVKALAEADPYAAIYLDAGHGGWLGWRDNMKDFVQTIRGLRVSDHIRGFASNVAGYQYVGEVCPEYDWCLNNAHPDDSCCNDPCGLTSEWNPSHNELQYALHLRKAMSEGISGFEPHMIIDTGRNGVAGMRSDCANWCNIRGAGVGLAATTNTAKPSVVDAYFWLKTPGESDGCSQTLPDGSTCPRFDEDCASEDSISFLPDEPRAPEAGQWFDYQIKQLAQNAMLYDSDTTTEASETTGGESTSSGPEKPDGNPFEDKVFYVNPSYQVSLTSSIQTAEGSIKETLEAMMDLPSAYWLDKRDKIHGTSTNSMEGILEDAASKPVPELVVFIVYDLPNRDCHAKASNGELCCSYKDDGRCDYLAVGDGSCKDGLKQYKEEYIDQIASVLREFSGRVPIVLVIEPDSLPNLSTNLQDPRCGNAATKSAYKRGVSYAVKALAEADPYAAIYLDAGHGGWLGWRDNMKDFVQTIRGLRVSDHIRGFASNVAGYQYVGEVCPEYDWCLNNAHPDDSCCNDPCGLTSEWNPSHNELQYALHLRKAMSEGIRDFEPHMIIDTGRNGVPGMRSDCANWCNIRGAGVGLAATTNTAKPSVVDAYFWLKTPGESDGCSQTLPDGSTCPRFDEDCASQDSISSRPDEPRAPEAGQWFDYQIKQLAENARLYE